MHIQFNAGEGVAVSEALEQHAHDRLNKVARRFGDRLTRVEVYLKDVNGPKGGTDKESVMEARPRGLQPSVAGATASDAYEAVKLAAERLEKVLDHRLGRLAAGNR